jgi:hypothetical protein
MKTIRSFAVFVSLATLAAACGENKAVTAARSMADAVCACKDIACAQKAASDGNAKLIDLASSTRGSEDDAKKILAESDRASKCIEALSPGAHQ